jgi:uncharacterized membrane protein
LPWLGGNINLGACMTLAPLLNAPLAVQIPALAALMLIPLTMALFSLPRGNRLHRILGWCWVMLMATVALSSFLITELRASGGFSPIHALSVFTLGALLVAVTAARRHQVSRHRRTMTWLTLGALVGAGIFTALPGRLMHGLLFGL